MPDDDPVTSERVQFSSETELKKQMRSTRYYLLNQTASFGKL